MVDQQRHHHLRWRLWQSLCTLGALLIVVSVWIAQSTPNQASSTASPLAQSLALMSKAQELVQSTQTLNADFDQGLQATLAHLATLVETPALPNVLKPKLSTLQTELTALQTEREKTNASLLKPAVLSKLLSSKPGAAAGKDLVSALQQWASSLPAAGDAAPTWAQLTESRAAWAQVMSAAQALQEEAQNTSAKNAKPAKDALTSFTALVPLPALAAHTQALSDLLQVHSQVALSLQQPWTPDDLAAARPWDWRRLGYPAEPTQGLLWAGGLLLLSLALGQAMHRASPTETTPPPVTPSLSHGQDLLAHKQWLSLLLHQREEAESALAHLLEASDKLGQVQIESHEPLFQLIWQMQSQGPSLTHEQQHLQQASAAQQRLQEEVQRLQEKLINVHLQFCQGAHQDNLMYDLAYLAEAFKDLQSSTEQLGQILNQAAQPPAEASQKPQPDQAFAERLDAWRAQLRQVTRQLNEAQASLEKSLKNVSHEEPRPSVFGSQANG